MRYHIVALLAVALCAHGAEIETITMADGRVLVGELTPKCLHGAVVALREPKGAAVTISMDDVRGREKWQPPQAVVYAPGTEPPAPAAKVKPAASPANTQADKLAAAAPALLAAKAKLQAAQEGYAQALKDYAAVVATMGVPEPTLGPDPRTSEVEAQHAAHRANALVEICKDPVHSRYDGASEAVLFGSQEAAWFFAAHNAKPPINLMPR